MPITQPISFAHQRLPLDCCAAINTAHTDVVNNAASKNHSSKCQAKRTPSFIKIEETTTIAHSDKATTHMTVKYFFIAAKY